jgi:protein CpxP
MKTKTVAISVLLLAIVLAPMAMAADEPAPRGPRGGQGDPGQGRGGRAGMGGGDMQGRMMGQLDLTEEQQKQIKSIREENKTQTQEAQQAVRKTNAVLQEAIESGSDDEILAVGKALGEAYGKQGVLRAQTARKIEAVLTPEQQAKMKELKAQMKVRMQQRGQGQGRPRGQQGQGDGQGRGKRQRPPQEQE